MRKTKIIGTVGPACDNDDILRHLIAEGMNVCRLNFSHGTHEEHKERIERIKRIREELNAPVPIMLDTKGPEYRIGEFDGRKVTLEDGQKFTFSTSSGTTRVSVSYKNLIRELSVGTPSSSTTVWSSTRRRTDRHGGHLPVVSASVQQKSMNFPNHVIHGEFLSDHDKETCSSVSSTTWTSSRVLVSTKDDVRKMRRSSTRTAAGLRSSRRSRTAPASMRRVHL